MVLRTGRDVVQRVALEPMAARGDDTLVFEGDEIEPLGVRAVGNLSPADQLDRVDVPRDRVCPVWGSGSGILARIRLAGRQGLLGPDFVQFGSRGGAGSGAWARTFW